MTDRTGDGTVEGVIPGGEAVHEQLLEASPVPLAVLDDDGRVVLANDRAERELGLREDELLGLSADDSDVQVIDEDGKPLDVERTVSRRVLRTGEPVRGDQVRVRLPNDRELWLSVSATPLPDGAGETMGAVLAFEDVTDRKRREQELRLKNRRLEDLANVISHEFRNPLQIARGFTEMAQRSGDPAHLDKVSAAHERMEALVDRLLELSNAPTGRQSAVDLTTAAERAWGRVEAAHATLSVEDGLPPVVADEAALVGLLEQLLENSVEHGTAEPGDGPSGTDGPTDAGEPGAASAPGWRDGGGVLVRVGSLSGESGFYVADDGPGVPEAERESLFEATPSSEGELGSFGLEVVSVIVEEHDWSIDATESEMGGARFEVRTGPSADRR